MREKTTLVTFAGRFGWVGVPLLLCSVGAVTFIIERLLVYAKLNSGTVELLQRVSDALSQKNVMDAIQACEEAATPISNVLKGGLLRHSQGIAGDGAPSKGDIQEAMAEGATLELPEFERNLTWLSMIAVVSPLFGLLGTVLGMIKAFTVIALEGTNDPNALAGGISEALYTTAAGLSIAAPALVFYAIFENIVNTNTMRIEIAATDTVNALMADGSSS
jgi:biopolymer transport protein ExbB